MAYMLLAIGALMSVAGAYLAISGYHIVQVEEGWSSVIAGAVMFVGGFLMMGLGLVLQALLQLKASLAAGPVAALIPADATARAAAPDAKIEPDVDQQLKPDRPVRHQIPDLPPPQPTVAPVLDIVPPGAPELESPLPVPPEPEPADAYELETPSTADHDLVAAPPIPEAPAPKKPAPLPRVALPRVALSQATTQAVATPQVRTTLDSKFQTSKTLEPKVQETKARDAETQDVPAEQATTPEALPRKVPEPTLPALPSENAPTEDDWLDRAFAEFDQDLPKTVPYKTTLDRTNPAKTKPVEPGPPETTPNHAPSQVVASLDAPAVDRPAPRDIEPVYAEAPDAEPVAADPAPPPPPPAAPLRPSTGPAAAVIGRYESDGTSYVMYADGSIEAHSDAGVYRFASMAELKAFIES